MPYLPVHEIKVDKSFVGALTTERHAGSIVSFIANLGRALGLHVVVEGVETHEVWTLLSALTCNAAQGYSISKPLPAAEMTSWLRNRSAA